VPEMKAAEHDVMKSRIGTPASIIASVVALMAALSAPGVGQIQEAKQMMTAKMMMSARSELHQAPMNS